jgi:hypothetical protein
MDLAPTPLRDPWSTPSKARSCAAAPAPRRRRRCRWTTTRGGALQVKPPPIRSGHGSGGSVVDWASVELEPTSLVVQQHHGGRRAVKGGEKSGAGEVTARSSSPPPRPARSPPAGEPRCVGRGRRPVVRPQRRIPMLSVTNQRRIPLFPCSGLALVHCWRLRAHHLEPPLLWRGAGEGGGAAGEGPQSIGGSPMEDGHRCRRWGRRGVGGGNRGGGDRGRWLGGEREGEGLN